MVRRYRRKRKRTYRRRKRRYTRQSPSNLSKRKTILPNKFKTNLLYGVQKTIAAGLVNVGTESISVNGLYDPEVAIGGHQPRGFDQYMLFFFNYTGIGAAIRVTFENIGENNKAGIVGIVVTSDPNPPDRTNLNNYIESGNCYYKKIEGETDGGPSVVEVKARCNPNKFLSLAKPLDNDRLKGSASANPLDQVFFHIFCYHLDGTVGMNVRANIRINYIAVFSQPLEPDQS